MQAALETVLSVSIWVKPAPKAASESAKPSPSEVQTAHGKEASVDRNDGQPDDAANAVGPTGDETMDGWLDRFFGSRSELLLYPTNCPRKVYEAAKAIAKYGVKIDGYIFEITGPANEGPCVRMRPVSCHCCAPPPTTTVHMICLAVHAICQQAGSVHTPSDATGPAMHQPPTGNPRPLQHEASASGLWPGFSGLSQRLHTLGAGLCTHLRAPPFSFGPCAHKGGVSWPLPHPCQHCHMHCCSPCGLQL